jgi:hypothetical protein
MRLVKAVTAVPGRRLAWLVLLGLTAAPCSGDGDLPAGWQEARSIPVHQVACCDGPDDPGRQRLVLTRDMDTLTGRYERALFCCRQQLCAYRLDAGGGAQVLVQPCEMDPAMPQACDCSYRVTFPLEAVAAGEMVGLYRRWSRTASDGDPVPVFVDSARAP